MKRNIYTVETLDGRKCGHNHMTAAAAEKCLRSLRKTDCRYYGATIYKNGARPNGVGMWADGESRV